MRFMVLEGCLESVACESGTFFLHIYPLGFAKCQPILYISNVEEYGRTPTVHTYGLGFAKCQPFLYIEGTNKQVINLLILLEYGKEI